MQHLLDFYENKLGAEGFYNFLAKKIDNFSIEFNNKDLFLGNKKKCVLDLSSPNVEPKDIRIDLPILLGKINSKVRIMILGLEPRHTNDFYNIFKVENKVFATPFGIDRWYSNNRKNMYASAFEKFLTKERLFLFSDFVKEYEVSDPNNKRLNDQKARENFKNKFSETYKAILEKEIEIFEPTLIIALGKTDINKKVDKQWLKQYNVNIISHPTNGNYNRMQSELIEILK
jgi:hypothetical protein